MTETSRIRWTEQYPGTIFGYVGTLESWEFELWRSDGGGDYAAGDWVLTPPFRSRQPLSGRDPDQLKAEAERWLEEFVTSLGAVFPEPPQPDPDCEECGFGLPRHDKDCSYYPGDDRRNDGERGLNDARLSSALRWRDND